MADHPHSTLATTLGIEPGARLALLHAPDGFDGTLGELPAGVTMTRSPQGPLDIAVAFIDKRSHLEKAAPILASVIKPDGVIWIAWPKASEPPTDMTEDVIREVVSPHGLVDDQVFVIDEIWTGLHMVRRTEPRGDTPPV